jgi:hypothetical protein
VGLGVWVWGLGVWGWGPNPQSPIPNPQSPIPNPHFIKISKLKYIYINKIYIFILINIKY